MDESSSGTLLYSPANDITPFQASKCIICENSKRCSVTSTTNGRTKIIEAASIKKDIVLERLNGIEENFVYHMDNECYKRYVMKKTIDKLTEAEESHSVASEYNGDDEMEPKSKRTRYDICKNSNLLLLFSRFLLIIN